MILLHEKNNAMAKISKYPVRTCRVCGCTDDDCSQCIAKTGEACYWVDEELCSACVNHNEVLESLKVFNKAVKKSFTGKGLKSLLSD